MAACVAFLSGINTLGNALALDDKVIVAAPIITGQTSAAGIWTHDYWYHIKNDKTRDHFYRPLTLQSLRWEHVVHGSWPAGFHATNLLLHSAVAALLVLVAAAAGLSVGAAALAGALFAVMPIHVDAVAGVVNRSDVLCALFALLTVWLAVRWRPSSNAGLAAKSVAMLLSVFAAMLSKETGVAAAALGVLFIAIERGLPRRRAALAGAILACGLAVVAYFALRLAATGFLVHPPMLASSNALLRTALAGRVWGAFQLLGMYVQKTFIPIELCCDYSGGSFDLATSPFQAEVVTGVFSLLLIGAAIVWWFRSGKGRLALCCAAILVCYFPVSNTLVLGTAVFAERLWYLPSTFLAISLVAACQQGIAARPHLARPVLALAGLLAIGGLIRGWVRNADWRDNGALFAAEYRAHPENPTAARWYGPWLVEHDRAEEGIKLLEDCVRKTPQAVDAQMSLARAYLRVDMPQRAVTIMQQVVMTAPDYWGAAELLQKATAQASSQAAGKLEASREAMERRPEDLNALLAYVDVLLDAGQAPEALAALEGREKLFASRPAFQRARATVLMATGKHDQAISAYRVCVQQQPDQAGSMVELAMALLVRKAPGDVDEAAKLVSRAAQLAPQDSGVLVAQAELDLLQGRRTQAAEIYERLARYAPTQEQREEFKARSAAIRAR